MATGTVVWSHDTIGAVHRITLDWTSTAGGAVSDLVRDANGNALKITGVLVKAVTNPGATAPTDNYDITITDEEGADVLELCHQTLANRDTANTEQAYLFLKSYDASPVTVTAYPVVADQLTVTIANAGAAKQGRLVLYYVPGVK